MLSALCEHCRATLRGNLLPGIAVLCPNCKKLTKVNHVPANGATAAPVQSSVAIPSPVPSASPVPTLSAHPAPRAHPVPSSGPVMPLAQRETTGRLLVTVLAAFAFLAVGGAILAWCFSGQRKEHDDPATSVAKTP